MKRLLLLVSLLWPALALGDEQKCVTWNAASGSTGIHCMCNEPLNGTTNNGGSTSWDSTVQKQKDPDDSSNALECVDLSAATPGYDGGYEIEGPPNSNYVVTMQPASSFTSRLPPGHALSTLFQVVSGPSPAGAQITSRKITENSPNATLCSRTYRMWGTGTNPSDTAADNQMKIANLGGFIGSTANPWQISWDVNHPAPVLTCRFDGNTFGADLVGGSTFPNTANYIPTNCINNLCRFEICLDWATSGVGTLRCRVTPVAPGNAANQRTYSRGPSPNAPQTLLFTQPSYLFNFWVSGLGTITTYNTHGIEVTKRPVDTGFWIGSACEVEGGCGGSPTWGVTSITTSPRASCEVGDAATCNSISLVGAASGINNPSGVISWQYDCDTSAAPGLQTPGACGDSASCNTGAICNYAALPVGNRTVRLCSTRNSVTGCSDNTFSVVPEPPDPPDPDSDNVALVATATAISERDPLVSYAERVNDGVINTDPGVTTLDWAANGQTTGAWIQLDWTVPVTVDEVILYDRALSRDHVQGGTLTFCNGAALPGCVGGTQPANVSVASLNDGGTGLSTTFSSRVITSIRFTVTSVSATTQHAGLSEFEVYEVSGQPAVWGLQSLQHSQTSCIEGAADCDNIDLTAVATGDAEELSTWAYDCDITGGYSGTSAIPCGATGDFPSDDGNDALITQVFTGIDLCDYSALPEGTYTSEVRTTKDGVASALQQTFLITNASDPTWGLDGITLSAGSCVAGSADCDDIDIDADEDGSQVGPITRTYTCNACDSVHDTVSQEGCDDDPNCVVSDACDYRTFATGVYRIDFTTTRGSLSDSDFATFTVTPRPPQIQGAGAQ